MIRFAPARLFSALTAVTRLKPLGMRRAAGLMVVAVAAVLIWSARVLDDRPVKYIHVRWQSDISAAIRTELEARFSLQLQQQIEDQSHGYDLLDDSRQNIRALVQHPAVADTHDIDRRRFTVAASAPDGDSLRVGLARRWGMGHLVPYIMPLGAVLMAAGTLTFFLSQRRIVRVREWWRTLLWLSLLGIERADEVAVPAGRTGPHKGPSVNHRRKLPFILGSGVSSAYVQESLIGALRMTSKITLKAGS